MKTAVFAIILTACIATSANADTHGTDSMRVYIDGNPLVLYRVGFTYQYQSGGAVLTMSSDTADLWELVILNDTYIGTLDPNSLCGVLSYSSSGQTHIVTVEPVTYSALLLARDHPRWVFYGFSSMILLEMLHHFIRAISPSWLVRTVKV